jgi:RHS repeat-associated protein
LAGTLGDATSSRTYSTGIVYDAASRMTQEQFGTTTAIYNKLAYNSRGQLAEMRAGISGNDSNRGKIINDYSDQCSGVSCNGTNNNGNLIQQTVYVPNNELNTSSTSWYQQYGYDSLNRLTQVHEYTGNTSIDWQQQYAYDRYGNRSINGASTATWGTGINIMQMAVVAGTTTNRMYAPGETESNHPTMNYDNAGNQTKDTYSAAAVTRAYDAENRMTKETQAGSYDAGTYGYDGDGRRVKRLVGATETWQVYGIGGELVAEYAANTDHSLPQKEYGYRNGQLLVTATIGTGWGNAPSYTAPDPLVTGVEIKLEHLTELRTAVNQLRVHAGLSAATWTTDPTPVRYVTEVKADHILELRAALEGARSHLGLSTGGYAHPGLHATDTIYAIDFQELRDQIAAAWTSVQVSWLVSDQLGTPRMIFDESGSLNGVSRHDYLPFGEELFAGTGGRTTAQGDSQSDGVRQHFTSKERDNETGLDFFEARYYSSTQGRFTSPDEFSGGPDEYYEFHELASENPTFYADLTDPQSLNKYQYCYNNPLLYIDPDGHQGVREWFRNTLNGAASTVSENNGLGRMDAPQTTTGRVIGHVISAAQAGGEIYAGVVGAVSGGAEAVVTSPACGTGVGCAVPAAGVVTVVGSAVIATHGTLVGINTVRNIFSKNNSQQGSGSKEQNKAEPPKKDRSAEGTQTQRENIQQAQKVHQKAGRPDRIRSIEKSKQNEANALKKIKTLKDAENR